jgi:nitrogen fixation protein FixH
VKWKSVVWPAAVIAALAVTVAANGVMLWAASGRGAAAVEPDYYRKAVAWDSTLALRRSSEELGWRLDAALRPAEAGGTELSLRLTGRDGRPIAGAETRVTAIHNLDPNHPIVGRLFTDPDGTGRAALDLRHPGRWELRFDAVRGAERFVTVLRREAEPAAR